MFQIKKSHLLLGGNMGHTSIWNEAYTQSNKMALKTNSFEIHTFKCVLQVDSKDKEFKVAAGEEEEADVEDTIAEQEKAEKRTDYSRELKDLEAESQ